MEVLEILALFGFIRLRYCQGHTTMLYILFQGIRFFHLKSIVELPERQRVHPDFGTSVPEVRDNIGRKHP